ncbi:aldehyde dehydrogenase family protein [Micromonospora carbonacea]|uniref:Acyl-CoA reductase n=1 Tax=Micromonospora carbonacea TaxID=47853 RepID=A0A1C4V7S5_9ACTN|nr:aldehyde dehydrogenase family protein [Micromonospora carbonacea]SCE80088.1 Acyl-CoA reductase [Micromonospora carbonacea]
MSLIRSPITGDAIREVADVTPAGLDDAFDAARAAAPVWRAVPPTERGRLLVEVGRRMRARIDEVAELETLNTGKLVADTRREAERAAGCFEYYGGYADKVVGSVIPVPGPFHTYTLREPYGVVAGIIPWNVPYFFAAKKIAPALAFGNVSLLKPAQETPLTALLLGEIVAEVLAGAGLPGGIVQVLAGGGELGRALVSDPRTDMVVFTGSARTGAAVGSAAAAHFAPAALELGGKSPQLVFADADLDAAVAGVVEGIVGSCGQMCIAGSRLYVQAAVYPQFLDRLADRVRGLRVGDPRMAGTQVGPQVTQAQADKTGEYIARGQADGGRLIAQAELPTAPELAGGYWVPPTVLADVDPKSPLLQEEVFGPVLAVDRFTDEVDAVELAHRTRFGLAAGVWTGDPGRAHRMAAALRVGTVWVNTYRILSDLVPFGGVGHSGYGREGGADAVGLYTWTKSVWLATDPGVPSTYGKG